MSLKLQTIDDVQEQLYNDLVDSFFNDNSSWTVKPTKDMYKPFGSWYYSFSCYNNDETFGANIDEPYGTDSNAEQDDKIILNVWCSNPDLRYSKSVHLDKKYRNMFHQRMLSYLGIHAQNNYNLMQDIREGYIKRQMTYYFDFEETTAFDIVNWCKDNLSDNEYYFEWDNEFRRALDGYFKETYSYRNENLSTDKLHQVKFYTTSEENLVALELALVDKNHPMFKHFNKTSKHDIETEDLRFLSL